MRNKKVDTTDAEEKGGATATTNEWLGNVEEDEWEMLDYDEDADGNKKNTAAAASSSVEQEEKHTPTEKVEISSHNSSLFDSGIHCNDFDDDDDDIISMNELQKIENKLNEDVVDVIVDSSRSHDSNPHASILDEAPQQQQQEEEEKEEEREQRGGQDELESGRNSNADDKDRTNDNDSYNSCTNDDDIKLIEEIDEDNNNDDDTSMRGNDDDEEEEDDELEDEELLFDDKVQLLNEMGFPIEDSKIALIANNNDLQLAIHALLGLQQQEQAATNHTFTSWIRNTIKGATSNLLVDEHDNRSSNIGKQISDMNHRYHVTNTIATVGAAIAVASFARGNVTLATAAAAAAGTSYVTGESIRYSAVSERAATKSKKMYFYD